MKKIKLLLYGDYYQKPSGFGREVRDLIPLLLAKGYDIRQVGLGFNGFPTDPAIKIYPGKFYNLTSYWASEMLEFALEDFKPDVVITLGDYYMLSKIAFAMAYPRKTKWVHWGVLDGSPLGFGCKEPLSWVDYNLYHSGFAKKEIEEVLPGIRGEVFYPATNPKYFYEIDKDKIKKQFNCSDKFVITTVARNQTRKNLPALLKAMPYIKKKIPEALLLLGLTQNSTTTPEGNREGHEIEYLINYYNVNDCVVIPKEKSSNGSVTDKMLREIYNLGDVFCLPSMGEGFGMIYHESMACGVPCIGTNFSATPETIGKYGFTIPKHTLFHSSDGVQQAIVHTDSLVDTVELAYKKHKKGELKVIGQQAKKYVSQFTPVKQADKLDNIIKQVITKDYQPMIRWKK